MKQLVAKLSIVSYIWFQTNCRLSSASGPQSLPLQMAVRTVRYKARIRKSHVPVSVRMRSHFNKWDIMLWMCSVFWIMIEASHYNEQMTFRHFRHFRLNIDIYLVMYLFLTECHKNDRYEEVEHHKGHEHNAGANEKSPKYWIIIKNLRLDERDKYNKEWSLSSPVLNSCNSLTLTSS